MKNINKKILIVEDDENFLFILQKVFTSSGFSVITAKNGEAAVELAKNEKPDIILSDFLLPRLDGMSMAKKLKELKITTPVVFLTNIENENKNDKEFDYLIKSKMEISEIVEKIKEKLKV
jgi:DNA-binding response OmpR family regulator